METALSVCFFLPDYYVHRGSRDGFTAESFHKQCDNQGETIIFIGSHCGDRVFKFGGYNSNSWSKKFKDLYDPQSYMFVLENPYHIIPTRYFPKENTHNILYKQLVGPIFGNSENMDLYLSNDMSEINSNHIEFNGDGAYEFTDISLSGHDSQLSQFTNIELPFRLFSDNKILVNEKGYSYVEFTVHEIEVYGY